MPIAINWRRRSRELSIFAAVGLFLAIVQPYNATKALPLWAGFFYWAGLIAVGSYVAEATKTVLLRMKPDLSTLVLMLTLSVAAAAAVTLVLFGLEWLISRQLWPLGYAPRIFGLVWVISAAMTGLGIMMDRTILAAPPEQVDGAGPIETFLSRLPLKYRKAELYAVSSEDHYLRIHTSLGEELILMRLGDAVRELAGAEGLQVHRSWWVAIPAIKDVRRSGGKTSLALPSGKEVPISKSYMDKAKAAGLV